MISVNVLHKLLDKRRSEVYLLKLENKRLKTQIKKLKEGK